MRALIALSFLAACTPDFTVSSNTGGVSDDGDSDGDAPVTSDPEPDVAEEDFSEWDGATLVIVSPESADFLPLYEDSDFEALVYDADGNATDFDDIQWTSSVDSAWTPTGADFTNADLDVGTHALSAQAVLPNGDRLVYTVGGVLVQHEDAGVYVGDMMVDLTGDYEGTPITTTCIGSAILVVDVYGETAGGDSTCTISLMGYDIQAAHAFDLVIDDSDLSGDANIDLSFFEYGMDVSGDIGGGTMAAVWADEVYGYLDLAGELEVDRITRDVNAL